MKGYRLVIALVVLAAFAAAGLAIAQSASKADSAGWAVVKGADGKPAVSEIVKGPFKTKAEAEKALQDLQGGKAPAKPPKVPDAGC